MALLDHLVSADEEQVTCELTVRADGLFDRDGKVPAYLGLEYMAQAVAAYSGYRARRQGQAVRLGFLLGTRHFSSNRGYFQCGERLRVRARKLMQSGGGMASFECTVTCGDTRQQARLSVYEPPDASQYLQESAACKTEPSL